MSKVIDEAGNRHGKLVILKRAGSNKEGKALWECLCDCGNKAIAIGKNLRNGSTHSCGCLVTIHGMTDTPVFNTWRGMHKRCSQPGQDSYKHYGGRGIKVCDRWQTFKAFYEDMGDSPGKGCSLDRIDNDGDYTPGNCRWATHTEQNRNRSFNHLITYQDKTQCVSAWAEEMDIKYTTLYRRITVCQWPAEKALTLPVRGRSNQALP